MRNQDSLFFHGRREMADTSCVAFLQNLRILKKCFVWLAPGFA